MNFYGIVNSDMSNTSYLYRWLNSSFIKDAFKDFNYESMLYNVTSNYFNPTTIMDIFCDKNSLTFIIPTIQNYLNTNTRSFILSLWDLSQNANFLIQTNSDLALMNLSFSSDLVVNTDFYKINSRIISEMSFLTKPKTDPFKIVDVIPEHQDTFEIFEVISINIDNSLYEFIHLPEFKLYYPEPFIASPSFVHEELWFIHILHYQHWLWFCFISLIMLFFITFINVVRWCNPRNKPKRETRGVSRSKCADLITACVPVSWAATIIISESVDSADYYDGFGTGEIVVGIRAYQWGWEYFFPKNIDLNYNVNPTYSTVTGNSLKYNNTTPTNASSNQFWKNSRSKTNNNLSSTPSHILLSPTDNSKILNFINFNNIGANTITMSNAFKKIQSSSKSNPQSLFNSTSDFSLKFNKINKLYSSDVSTQDSLFYGMKRQHNYSSINTLANNQSTKLDSNSFNKLLNYNFNDTDNSSGSTPVLNESRVSHNLSYSQVQDNLKEFNSLKTSNTLNASIANSKTQNKTLVQNTNSLNSLTNNISSDLIYKNFFIKSPNQQILSSDRNIRNIDTINPNKLNTNFNLNTPTTTIINQSSTALPEAHLPTGKSGSSLLTKSFDSFTDNNMNSPILAAKEELAPNFIFTPFWLSLWGGSDLNLRLGSVGSFSSLETTNTVPTITEYSEYDFRNWQSIELLEDSFWESTFSSYTQDDYSRLLSTNKNTLDITKHQAAFNTYNRLVKSLPKALTKPFFRDYINTTNLSSLPIFSEESYTNPNLLNLSNFGLYDNELEFDIAEDSYLNLKFINYLHYTNYLNIIGFSMNNVQPFSYTQTLNPFRADYDETFNSTSLESSNADLNLLSEVDTSTDRSSNFIKLRSTAKNAIVTFNALQKVFRPRFDEGRSNVRFQDLSNTYTPYPFLSETRTSYESILGKNKESFFTAVNYKNTLSDFYSSINPTVNALNIYFGNIPFLLSMQSDASRHMWFDWQSRWTSIEVQPSSVARYSLLGVPYSSKNFEYATQQSDELNDSETYLLRLSKARKNYMSNWALTPYLYTRISNWYATNGLLSFTTGNLSVNSLRLTLNLSDSYWKSGLILPSTGLYTPSLSDINTPGRSSWKPTSNIQGYNYTVSTLINLLTKREYLYREYFLNKGFSVNLPNYLTSSPNNTLLEEIKSSYSLVDPTSFVPEAQRDFFYNNTYVNKFEFMVYYINLVNTLNLNLNLNTFIYYLFTNNTYDKLGGNDDLYKNQFRPIRKGISNMIRLHATGAIAMPTEIRLHILASSKDIIHSWAIPSAGIKIDCVPGYSSHRVAIFLVSGIFWGQCMEICGRFHHWMPIIVYFMKRDLFFLWCTHFIHFSPNELSFNTADKEFTSKNRNVSFSATNWV